MKNEIHTAMLIVLSVILGGCAATSEYMRTEPVLSFPVSQIALPSDVTDYLTVQCVQENPVANSVNSHTTRRCLYVSASTKDKAALSVDKSKRDLIMNYLIELSDANCFHFQQRIFANKTGLDLTKSLTADLSSALSAGTAHSNPAISATLSGANIIIGKGVDSFNSSYYYDKTSQAVQAAMDAQRLRILQQIIARQAAANRSNEPVAYDLSQALSDVRKYDNACSLKAGLDQLIKVTEAEKATEDGKKKSLELSANPVAEQQKNISTNK